MKKTVIILSVIALIASGCGQNTTKQVETVNNEITNEQKEESTQSENEQINSSNKFLITNNSAGYFTIGGSWQDFARNKYQYEFVQGYGTCVDACCNGGFQLGNGIIKNDWNEQVLKDLKLTIGALRFEVCDESLSDKINAKKHKNNPDVFYVSSDNCKGWYWKDKISFMILYSDLFKTKEGVGVGTTLEDAQKKLGILPFYVGWLEENPDAVQICTRLYPNITFILDPNDYANGWEELSTFMGNDDNSLTISDFKPNTQIKRIIIRGASEDDE
ncbi:MAG: hypothetical protein FWC39_12650 [Bacteroidetes bacterium]|nr:hypothetical protein [Bacteroidota bacterium]